MEKGSMIQDSMDEELYMMLEMFTKPIDRDINLAMKSAPRMNSPSKPVYPKIYAPNETVFIISAYRCRVWKNLYLKDAKIEEFPVAAFWDVKISGDVSDMIMTETQWHAYCHSTVVGKWDDNEIRLDGGIRLAVSGNGTEIVPAFRYNAPTLDQITQLCERVTKRFGVSIDDK